MIEFFFNLVMYFFNSFVNKFPSYLCRKYMYRIIGIYIGRETSIKMGVTIENRNIIIGNNVSVGRKSHLDGRGKILIKNNVSISPEVVLITASHDLNSPSFNYTKSEIIINDNVWIGTRAMIIGQVELGEGAVVAAGAVVTKNVAPYTIVAGIPAKEIGKRARNIKYKINWSPPFN